jgi:hypothetical protein
MNKAFSQEHLDRIQEAHNRNMADESIKVANSVKNRLENIAQLFGYHEAVGNVSITINSSYSLTLDKTE